MSAYYVYDLETDIWTDLGDMPAPRMSHSSGVVDGKIYLYGDYTSIPPLGDFNVGMWQFDPDAAEAWSEPGFPLPGAHLTDFVSAVAKDEAGRECLYAIGGSVLNNYSDAVYKYPVLTTSAREADNVPEDGIATSIQPNPCTFLTTIRYALPKSTRVHITIFDAAGREVKVMDQGYCPTGEHWCELNAAELPAGLYFYRISGGTLTGTGRFVKQG